MNNDFDEEQYLNLVHNTIFHRTQFSINELTGGNIQLTCAGGKSCKMINAKVVLYFGYDQNRNNRKYEQEIAIDLINIWLKALHISLLNKKALNNGDYIKELNMLMNKTTPAPTMYEDHTNKNEVVGKEVKGKGSGSGIGLGIGTNVHDDRTNNLLNIDLDEIPS